MESRSRFACLCATVFAREDELRSARDLGAGLMLRPAGLLKFDDWTRVLGTERVDRMRGTNLQVWIAAPPNDASTRTLIEKLYNFWKALLITRAPRTHDGWIFVGDVRGSTSDVTMFEELDRVVLKEPTVPLTVETMTNAALTAQNLESLFQSNVLKGRLERGLTALFGVMTNKYVDEGILALERALEGFLHPADREQFEKRLASVVTMPDKSAAQKLDLFKEIYAARSQLVHAEPIDEVFTGPRETALLRARQLQTFMYLVAARSYSAILADSPLAARLSREKCGEFWGKVVAGKRPPPFEVQVLDSEWEHDHADLRNIYSDGH